jgi:hypothetical protein
MQITDFCHISIDLSLLTTTFAAAQIISKFHLLSLHSAFSEARHRRS